MKRQLVTIVTLSMITVVGIPVAAGALEKNHPEGVSSPQPSPQIAAETTRKAAEDIQKKVDQQKQDLKQQLKTAQTEMKQRLDDDKRKICDNHQTQINTIMKKMDDRRQDAYDRITKAYEAVKAFYTDKGLSVSNYDTLVASVNAAQTAANTAMQTQQDVPTFSCNGDHPRADITDFKTKRLGSIDAMQTYRQAVKALIAAVRTAAKEAAS